MQVRRCEFATLLHGLEGFAVDKREAAAAEIGTHVDRSGIEPFPLAHDAGQGEGIVGIGEQVLSEIVTPGGDLGRGSLAGGGAGAAETDGNGFLLPAVFEDFRAFDENCGAGGGLVADHLRRAGAAARRADTLAVGAGGDDYALAGLEGLGSLVDGFEGMLAGAGAVVTGLGGLLVHVIGLGEFKRLFPEGKLSAVGQACI